MNQSDMNRTDARPSGDGGSAQPEPFARVHQAVGRAPPEPVAEATGGGEAPDPTRAGMPPEHGGQAGPEPTRYGDWEKNGRCTDF